MVDGGNVWIFKLRCFFSLKAVSVLNWKNVARTKHKIVPKTLSKSLFSKLTLFSLLDYFLLCTCNTFLRWLISDKEKRTNWYPEQIPFKDFWFNTWWAPGRYWLFRFFTVYQIKKKRGKMLFSQLPSKVMYHKYFKHWKKTTLQSRQGR